MTKKRWSKAPTQLASASASRDESSLASALSVLQVVDTRSYKDATTQQHQLTVEEVQTALNCVVEVTSRMDSCHRNGNDLGHTLDKMKQHLDTVGIEYIE